MWFGIIWSCEVLEEQLGSLILSWMISEAKNLELFSITAWTVWNQCNKVRLNQIATALHQVASISRAWWQEFKAQQVVVEGNMRQG